MRENHRPKLDPGLPGNDVRPPNCGAKTSKNKVSELTNAISLSGGERPQEEDLFTYLLFCYITLAYF